MPSSLRRAPLVAQTLVVALVLLGALLHAGSAEARMTKGLQDTRLVMSDDPADRSRFWGRAEQARVGRVRVLTTWDGKARTVDPTALLRLRRAAEDARAAKAELVVGIYAPVLVGEPAPNARTSNAVNPGRFFREALCLNAKWRPLKRTKSCGRRLLGDGIAIHAHDFTHAPSRRRASKDAWTIGNVASAMRQLRALARARRISTKASRNVHITEFAYRTHGSARTPDTRAARWLRDAWKLAAREGVKSFSWYQLQDPGLGHEWRSGLITGTERPLRTWQTFRYLR
jgi:hypothetical protein